MGKDKKEEKKALVEEDKGPVAPKPIPRRAICNSILELQQMHPLKKTVSWRHVGKCCYCFCCECCKKKKGNFNEAL